MRSTLFAFVCVCFSTASLDAHEGLSHRPAEAAATIQGAAPAPDTRLLGLEALSPLVTWLSTLPRAFEEFVTNERREQLVRLLRNVAKGFANVNIDCETVAALAARPGLSAKEMEGDFNTLLDSIIDLRKSILELAAELSDQWKTKGSALAFELANLTRARGDLTNQARERLLSGNRAEAAANLRAAAALALDAQKLVIEFLATASRN